MGNMSAERQVEGSLTDLADDSEGDSEVALVDALLDGREDAFVRLINLYSGSMLRLAMIYVPDRAVAEDVVQETWVGVLNGLRNFERRSSLKTWLFRILTNQARTRGKREARTIPFSDLSGADADGGEYAPDQGSFVPLDAPRWAGHWTSIPRSWNEIPEERLLSQETKAEIYKVIETLPPSQRQVITMRDVEGMRPEDISNILGITDTNQRVLLHRARSKVRLALEEYLQPD